jgi:two-component system sensor histidine kinase/response regulator
MNSGQTILIIDDDVHLAATYALGLEANGYRVLCAPNAAQGWEAARAHLPDLILCDIEMPGKDGRRLLQEMRADPVLADRQFVLMTGKAALGSPRKAMDLGADDFLPKPCKLPALLACVAARLRRAELSRRLDDRAVAQLRENLHANLPQEFFNPLAVILGLTELLQGDFHTLSPDEIRQDLRDILRAGRRLHRLLRNYLLILELESAGVVRPGALLDPDMVVDALTVGVGAAGERHQRGADLILELDGARLRAEATDLTTIAEELVDNAYSFSRPDTPVRVRSWKDGDRLRLSVSDGGRGMTVQQLNNLGAFQQHHRRTPDQHGLGLGLVLVRLLAGQLGGEFHLESEAGKGTTSHLTLPIIPD